MEPKTINGQIRIFKIQTANYLKALADTGQPVQLIAAVQNIRDHALTANHKEWEQEEYWKWWKSIRPAVYQ